MLIAIDCNKEKENKTFQTHNNKNRKTENTKPFIIKIRFQSFPK